MYRTLVEEDETFSGFDFTTGYIFNIVIRNSILHCLDTGLNVGCEIVVHRSHVLHTCPGLDPDGDPTFGVKVLRLGNIILIYKVSTCM